MISSGLTACYIGASSLFWLQIVTFRDMFPHHGNNMNSVDDKEAEADDEEEDADDDEESDDSDCGDTSNDYTESSEAEWSRFNPPPDRCTLCDAVDAVDALSIADFDGTWLKSTEVCMLCFSSLLDFLRHAPESLSPIRHKTPAPASDIEMVPCILLILVFKAQTQLNACLCLLCLVNLLAKELSSDLRVGLICERCGSQGSFVTLDRLRSHGFEVIMYPLCAPCSFFLLSTDFWSSCAQRGFC